MIIKRTLSIQANKYKETSKQPDSYTVHEEMDSLRKEEGLCGLCELKNNEPMFSGCPSAKIMFKVCQDYGMAMAITRCGTGDNKGRYLCVLQDDQQRHAVNIKLNKYRNTPKQPEFYTVQEEMDGLRREESLCRICDRQNDKPTYSSCPVAKVLYQLCQDQGLAVAVTRCGARDEQGNYLFERFDY